MNLSAWIFASDLLPKKRSALEKLVKKSLFVGSTPGIIFGQLKAAGVDGIELLIPKKFSVKEAEQVRKILSIHNLKINSIHEPFRYPLSTTIKHVTKLFLFAKILDAKVLVLHIDRANKRIFTKEYVEHVKQLEKSYDIAVGYENSQRHHVLWRRRYSWDQNLFAKTLLSKNLKITLDTTHLSQAGGDIRKFFQKNKESIVNIHLSDYKEHRFDKSLRPKAYTHMPLGSGELPIPEFLELLKKENYKGLVTMEIDGSLEDLCESARMIRKILS